MTDDNLVTNMQSIPKYQNLTHKKSSYNEILARSTSNLRWHWMRKMMFRWLEGAISSFKSRRARRQQRDMSKKPEAWPRTP